MKRIGDVWERFMVLSWWEKGLMIGAGVLLAVLTPMAAFALMGGDGGQAALFPTSTPVAIIADSGPTPTITPQATSTPKAVPATRTLEALNREDCGEIRGTDYQSDDERDWFIANCDDGPEPVDTVPPPVNRQPTNTPQPEPSISAAEARSMAAGWIRGNVVFSELSVSSAGCDAQPSGSGWRVSCTGTTPGCQVAVCDTTIWVCISSDGRMRQC